MNAPQWVLDEINRRVAEARLCYASLPDSMRGMRDEADYVRLYVNTNYEPLTWASGGAAPASKEQE